jgi:hypothetical protein
MADLEVLTIDQALQARNNQQPVGCPDTLTEKTSLVGEISMIRYRQNYNGFWTMLCQRRNQSGKLVEACNACEARNKIIVLGIAPLQQ